MQLEGFIQIPEQKYQEEDLISVIKAVIHENLGLKEVGRFDDFTTHLKMDEPTRLEILLAIEYVLGCRFENQALYSVNSIDDAVKLYYAILMRRYDDSKVAAGC